MGIDALVLDSDIAVLRDPFQALHGDADFEVMTDHFWPSRHLWQYWVRPEENINTGFIFVRASPRTAAFLTKFLKEHAEPSVAGIPRHWMDQQVFNKFVIRYMLHGKGREVVHGLYEDQVFRHDGARAVESVDERPTRIRILDPAVVAHGMNYFWLRAHNSPGNTVFPVVAHANGVDGKEYFLRDRGLWFIDDFKRRFAGVDFLTYEHMSHLSLESDFDRLTKALVVAGTLVRKLVLPRTMNCANCPALAAFGANLTAAARDCTFDYFAWSQAFLGHHGDRVVESGIMQKSQFRRLSLKTLPSDSFSLRDALELERQSLDATSDVQELPRRGKRRRARVLHVADLQATYDEIMASGASFSDVFECRYHQWPVGWMACRDQRFVSFFGDYAKCSPGPGQTGCGLRGLSCCETFWGWGEKLEYFTGRPWDLPCNCGIEVCTPPLDPAGLNESVCCKHHEGGAEHCGRPINMASAPAVNPPEDSHTYTSDALSELEDRRGGPEAFWATCGYHRRLRFADADIAALAQRCDRLASRYLLLKQKLPALGAWCRFAAVRGIRPAAQNVPVLSPGLSSAVELHVETPLRESLAALRSENNGEAVIEGALREDVSQELEQCVARVGVSADASLLDGPGFCVCEPLMHIAQSLATALSDVSGKRFAFVESQAASDVIDLGPAQQDEIVALLSLGSLLSSPAQAKPPLRRVHLSVMRSSLASKRWPDAHHQKAVDNLVLLTFAASLGRPLFPGLTRRTNARWADDYI
eukprot:TRINITY_DN25290_c0_g1_i1.p1 TRINITY_DN25290_c0_g1~~TRINITY_DN25290_c0_g1_i1.p1  ORF type:complete len:808 (-),score=99.97 TRINITY_DN25290_c0_g1_i1:277-2547(-)